MTRARAAQAQGHAKAAARGWAFKGAERVSPYSRAKPLKDRHQVKARYSGDSESIKRAIARDVVFRERYAAARDRWLAGDRHVIWSAGTCATKRSHGVPCETRD